jgi:hypothetical protein
MCDVHDLALSSGDGRLSRFWGGWFLGPENCFIRENPAYAASRFRYISFEARDEVHVDVTHGLSSSKAFIDTNIEAIGL